MPHHHIGSVRIAVYTVVAITTIACLSAMTRSSDRVEPPTIPRTYLEEASRWATISSQESNPILALTHINYAIACANVAAGMTSKRHLSDMMGADFPSFMKLCNDHQSSVLRSLSKRAPSLAPDTRMAIASGWI